VSVDDELLFSNKRKARVDSPAADQVIAAIGQQIGTTPK